MTNNVIFFIYILGFQRKLSSGRSITKAQKPRYQQQFRHQVISSTILGTSSFAPADFEAIENCRFWCPELSSIKQTAPAIEIPNACPGFFTALCNSKFTGKETGTTHLCAVQWLISTKLWHVIFFPMSHEKPKTRLKRLIVDSRIGWIEIVVRAWNEWQGKA